jgi:hypothetical protein
LPVHTGCGSVSRVAASGITMSRIPEAVSGKPMVEITLAEYKKIDEVIAEGWVSFGQ